MGPVSAHSNAPQSATLSSLVGFIENSKFLWWLKELLFYMGRIWKTWKNWTIMPHGEAECLHLYTRIFATERNGKKMNFENPVLSHLWQTGILENLLHITQRSSLSCRSGTLTHCTNNCCPFSYLFIAHRMHKSQLFTSINPPPGSWDRSLPAPWKAPVYPLELYHHKLVFEFSHHRLVLPILGFHINGITHMYYFVVTGFSCST